LEKTLKIIKSNHPPNSTVPTKPYQEIQACPGEGSQLRPLRCPACGQLCSKGYRWVSPFPSLSVAPGASTVHVDRLATQTCHQQCPAREPRCSFSRTQQREEWLKSSVGFALKSRHFNWFDHLHWPDGNVTGSIKTSRP